MTKILVRSKTVRDYDVPMIDVVTQYESGSCVIEANDALINQLNCNGIAFSYDLMEEVNTPVSGVVS